MAPLPKPRLPAAAEPRYGRPFDPWNSTATGHQRPETRGPNSWRESRNAKLANQFAAGHTAGRRVQDAVGAGSRDVDNKRRMLVSKGVRARAGNKVADMLQKPGAMKQATSAEVAGREEKVLEKEPNQDAWEKIGKEEVGAQGWGSGNVDLGWQEEGGGDGDGDGDGPGGMAIATATRGAGVTEQKQEPVPILRAPASIPASAGPSRPDIGSPGAQSQAQQPPPPPRPGNIFDGLIIYINGSTQPVVSDHKLKRLLAENGARTSVHLGRRQVTHVILGKPGGGIGGAGGGLAGGKLDKEIRRVRGRGIKYVGAEWVLESVKAGKRLPEARFANLVVASKGQQSVLGAFSKPRSS